MSLINGGMPLTSRQASELEYQSFLLVKVNEIRSLNGKNFRGLRYANGLNPIPPETEIRGSLINTLLPTHSYEENGALSLTSNCEILIVVAMYNESSEHFNNTMLGINQNLADFRKAGVDTEKIACIVIIDGIKAYLDLVKHERDFFGEYFKDDKVKQFFNVEDITKCKLPNQDETDEFAHCFSQSRSFGNCTIPLKIIFCVKHLNKRKLNTHLWFFGGFCAEFQPTYVILLDVGTRPLPGSLFYMYEAMYCNPNLAGCCGEIKPMQPNFWKIVVPAQVVEYKFSHMLDKALESVTGFITVLPGAFSAYRWEALWKGTDELDPESIEGSPLWEDYFKSICHPELMDAFQSNIYLAEDRVLCLALFTKKNKNYILRYVKKSIGETDVPDSIAILMSQRRRWINGSWFALIDSLKKCGKVFESSHNCCRKLSFSLQMLYYLITVVYSWFLVGAFCLSVEILVTNYFTNSSAALALIIFYVGVLLVTFIISLAVKPKRVEDLYKMIVVVLALYQIFTIYLMVTYLISNGNNTVTLAILLTVVGFVIIIILNCEIVTIAFGVIHYILLIPTYVNIFLIYSICNVHDCTWGNRPDNLNEEEKQRTEEFEEFRAKWVIIWVICNSSFSYFLNLAQKDQSKTYYFFVTIAGIGITIILVRLFGGIIYFFSEKCKKTIKLKENPPVDTRGRRLTNIASLRYEKKLKEVNPFLTSGKPRDNLSSNASEKDDKEEIFLPQMRDGTGNPEPVSIEVVET